MKLSINGAFGPSKRSRALDTPSPKDSMTRRSPRLLWTASAIIHNETSRHVGLVRDLSSQGIGLYSDFTPKTGTSIEVAIRIPHSEDTLLCKGKVVRVDARNEGAATRIGVSLENCVVRPAFGKEQQALSITKALALLSATFRP
jgi:hypothetical protein